MYGSRKNTFPRGSYLAAHVTTGPYRYNGRAPERHTPVDATTSPRCARGTRGGATARTRWPTTLAGKLGPGGEPRDLRRHSLRRLQLGHQVRQPDTDQIDVNADGRADGGVIGGVNTVSLGVHSSSSETLRERLARQDHHLGRPRTERVAAGLRVPERRRERGLPRQVRLRAGPPLEGREHLRLLEGEQRIPFVQLRELQVQAEEAHEAEEHVQGADPEPGQELPQAAPRPRLHPLHRRGLHRLGRGSGRRGRRLAAARGDRGGSTGGRRGSGSSTSCGRAPRRSRTGSASPWAGLVHHGRRGPRTSSRDGGETWPDAFVERFGGEGVGFSRGGTPGTVHGHRGHWLRQPRGWCSRSRASVPET